MSAAIPLPVKPGLALDHRSSGSLDRLGIAASFLCLIHCVASPVLVLLLPAVAGAWSHPAAHWAAAALVVPLALAVVFRGYRRHRRHAALASVVLGSGLIVLGIVVPGPEVFALPMPGGWFDASSAASADACADRCCPSVVAHDAHTEAGHTAAAHLSVPLGTAATLAGSLLLVVGHAINLHGCRCLSRAYDQHPADCACA